ncbi:MAG TPA: 2-oxo acid dehydrogenase subunit E2, partial [Cellvibrionaceae bacterium]|nr:2-oxo acid dehydrogenase subunit E2 [Cellvibrionaceae bacterium]
DISTVIDKRFAGGVRMPAVYTVRQAQNKTLAEINFELRQAMRADQSQVEAVRLRQGLTRAPKFIRRLAAWWMARNPFVLRRFHGTLGLTSLHAQGFNRPLFAIAPNIFTLTLAVGSISERLGKNTAGEYATRKILCLSAGADHLVIDGAPLARFAQCLIAQVESATGLDAQFVAQTLALNNSQLAETV